MNDAREPQKSFGMPPAGSTTKVVPYDPRRAPEPSGSIDVGNVIWVAPCDEPSLPSCMRSLHL